MPENGEYVCYEGINAINPNEVTGNFYVLAGEMIFVAPKKSDGTSGAAFIGLLYIIRFMHQLEKWKDRVRGVHPHDLLNDQKYSWRIDASEVESIEPRPNLLEIRVRGRKKSIRVRLGREEWKKSRDLMASEAWSNVNAEFPDEGDPGKGAIFAVLIFVVVIMSLPLFYVFLMKAMEK